MKTKKYLIITLVAVAASLLFLGASSDKQDRPIHIAEDQWISVSEEVGFVVYPDDNSESVAAELYLKTGDGWRRARLENPVHAYPLSK